MSAKKSPPAHIKHLWVRRLSPFPRLVLLTTMLAIALALVALSACSEAGDNNPSASTPPPTSPPDVPQPPAAAVDVPSPGSGAEDLFVLPGGFETMELILLGGDSVTVTYSAIGASTGGITKGGDVGGEKEKQGPGTAKGEVILTILNPVEDQILNVEQLESNTAEFQADLDGKYQLVFSNPFRLQGIIVPVEFTIAS